MPYIQEIHLILLKISLYLYFSLRSLSLFLYLSFLSIDRQCSVKIFNISSNIKYVKIYKDKVNGGYIFILFQTK